MLKRVLVAVVCLPVIAWIFYFAPPIVLPVAISLLSVLGVHEVLWSTGFVRNWKISALSLLLAGVVPFWVYIGQGMKSALVGIFLYFALMFLAALASDYQITMEKMGGSFYFAMLIPYFLSTFIRLNSLPLGRYLIAIPLLAAFTCDIFALFTGMALGRHKLAPRISPKKTVEGAVGGVAGGILCCLGYGLLMERGFHLQVDYVRFFLYGLLGSLAAILGDLSFSYIKRQYGIKDFSNILPGHGGVLDRFDSVIFCAPLMEILIRWLPALL